MKNSPTKNRQSTSQAQDLHKKRKLAEEKTETTIALFCKFISGCLAQDVATEPTDLEDPLSVNHESIMVFLDTLIEIVEQSIRVFEPAEKWQKHGAQMSLLVGNGGKFELVLDNRFHQTPPGFAVFTKIYEASREHILPWCQTFYLKPQSVEHIWKWLRKVLEIYPRFLHGYDAVVRKNRLSYFCRNVTEVVVSGEGDSYRVGWPRPRKRSGKKKNGVLTRRKRPARHMWVELAKAFRSAGVVRRPAGELSKVSERTIDRFLGTSLEQFTASIRHLEGCKICQKGYGAYLPELKPEAMKK